MLRICLLGLMLVGVACGNKSKSSERKEEPVEIVAPSSRDSGTDAAAPSMEELDNLDMGVDAYQDLLAGDVVRFGNVSVTGDFDTEVIRSYLRMKVSSIRYCFEKELLTNPSLEGDLVATFSIDAKGEVQGVKAKGVSSTVDSCVAKRIASIQFPNPKGTADKVSCPISFRSPSAK